MDYEKAYKQLIQKKREGDALYRERHKDEIKIRFKAWYEKNREKLATQRREKRNQEKVALLTSSNSAADI
jgi:hypothetical protein